MYYDSNRFASGSFVREPKRMTVQPLKLCAEELSKNTTLLVVDPLLGEPAANDPEVLAAMVRQVKLARRQGWAVLFLSTEPWRRGDVRPCLTEPLAGYSPRWFTKVKAFDNGALEVRDACFDFNYPTGFFRICGVNTDLCVQSTTGGLLKLFPQAGFRVIKEACASFTRLEKPDLNSTDPHQHWYWFKEQESKCTQLCVSSEAIDKAFPSA